MINVSFDFETYSEADLKAVGTLSGRVDGFDLVVLARAFGSVAGAPAYDPAVDLDRDGDIDGDDLAILAANFGQSV